MLVRKLHILPVSVVFLCKYARLPRAAAITTVCMASKKLHCPHGCKKAFVWQLMSVFNKESFSNRLRISLHR